MQTRQAFKLGFLRKCAELGLSPAESLATVRQIQQQLAQPLPGTVKQALTELLSRPLETAYDVGGHLLKNVGNVGLATMLAGPPLAGAAAGLGLAKITDIDDQDVEAVKKRELIDEYLRQAALLRRRRRPLPS